MPRHIAAMMCVIYPATPTVPETITNKSQTGVFGLAQNAAGQRSEPGTVTGTWT